MLGSEIYKMASGRHVKKSGHFEIPSLSETYMLNSEPTEGSLCHMVINRQQVCLTLV